MIPREDIHVMEEFGNARAPHQYRVTHTPTGIFVIGNTGSEEMKPQLLTTLILKLEEALPATERAPAADNTMQSQLDAMQAKIDMLVNALAGGKVASRIDGEAPKKRGRKPGTKVQDGKVVAPQELTHPEGYSVLDPTMVQPMPASIPPLPTRAYKPTTVVAKVSDKAAAKGIQA